MFSTLKNFNRGMILKSGGIFFLGIFALEVILKNKKTKLKPSMMIEVIGDGSSKVWNFMGEKFALISSNISVERFTVPTYNLLVAFWNLIKSPFSFLSGYKSVISNLGTGNVIFGSFVIGLLSFLAFMHRTKLLDILTKLRYK